MHKHNFHIRHFFFLFVLIFILSSISMVFSTTANPDKNLISNYMSLEKTGEEFEGYNIFILRSLDSTLYELTIIHTNGTLIKTYEIESGGLLRGLRLINSTTILVGNNTNGAFMLNLYTNKIVKYYFPRHHHDMDYNPHNGNLFTFTRYYIDLFGHTYGYDYIDEKNSTGHVVWRKDSLDFVPTSQYCPFGDLEGSARDITHANTLYFDAEEDVFYVNFRNTNTFYKIDHQTGELIWSLGEYGNFTLYDVNGRQKQALFYHAHSVEPIDENTFIIFDNDYHNKTNNSNQISRLVEITINETTMTANESWVWAAPRYEYYCNMMGDADRLPNGDRLGAFGPWTHPSGNAGPILTEVNEAGEIVWEMRYPEWKSIYRMERFRRSPVIGSPQYNYQNDELEISWPTWYNFRTRIKMYGSYKLYHNGDVIRNGGHTFDKYWRPTELKFNLALLSTRDHNLTLVVFDEGGHPTYSSIQVVDGKISQLTSSPLTTTTSNSSMITASDFKSSQLQLLGILFLLVFGCLYITKRKK